MDRALDAAREYLGDEEIGDVDVRLFAGFQRHGASLFIDATMSMLADRYFASAVLGALAWHARDGFVEVVRGHRVVDQIISAGAYRETIRSWE